MASAVVEFDRVGSISDFESLRARVLSLRDVALGCQDPQANVMPFERDASGAWRASRWIGTFRHNGVDFSITPRIGKKRFLWIAVDAVSAALLPDGMRPHGSNPNGLRDLLPLVWCLALRHARSRQGIPRLYVQRRAADRVSLRGRFDLLRQLTENRFAQHHLACIWNELTFDNPVTRTILSTIDHLARERSFPFGRQGGDFARELEGLRTQLLLHGARLQPNLPEEGISWSRANDRYRAVHDLGRAIIRRRGSDGASEAGETILLDSAEIWELFLFRKLEEVIRAQRLKLEIKWPRGHRAPPHLLEWEGQRVRMLIPDIVIRETDGEGRVAILDAKYRFFVTPDRDHSIADQMALYAMTAERAAAAPTMLLVYPKAGPSTGSEGLNSSQKCGCIGKGRFLFPDKREFRLIAWCVPLPEDEQIFEETIKKSLSELMRAAFPAAEQPPQAGE
jgi:hypothetical protein